MRSPQLRNAEVEEGSDWLYVLPDGTVCRDPIVSIDEETYRQIWNGWMCAWCYEPWDVQWPECCSLAGCFSGPEMSEELQRRYMVERFGGERWFGPSRETVEREGEAAEHAGFRPRSGIWVPGDPS